MREKKQIRTRKAVTIRLCIFALVIWLLFSFIITFTSAEHVYHSMLSYQQVFAAHRASIVSSYEGRLPMGDYDPDDFREIMDRAALNTIIFTNHSDWARQVRFNINRGWRPLNLLRRVFSDFQTATVIFDADGNIIRHSSSILLVRYVTQDTWDAGVNMNTFRNAEDTFIVFDNIVGENSPAMLLSELYRSDTMRMGFSAARITGYFDGIEFMPVKFSYIPPDIYWQAVTGTGINLVDGHRTLNFLDRHGYVDWLVLFDNTAAFETRDDLTTIYSFAPWLHPYAPGGSVFIQGRRYENLLAFLKQTAYQNFMLNKRLHPAFGGFVSGEYSRFGLREILITNGTALRDLTDYNFDADEPLPEMDFLVLSAISGSPLLHAIRELLFVYIITLVIVAIAVLALRRTFYNNLIQPLEAVNKGYTAFFEGKNTHKYLDCYDPDWLEPAELTKHYRKTTHEMLSKTNEPTPKNTTKEDKKEAE